MSFGIDQNSWPLPFCYFAEKFAYALTDKMRNNTTRRIISATAEPTQIRCPDISKHFLKR